ERDMPAERKRPAAPVRGVIYDLDGTLVDSRDDIADTVNAMLGRLSLPQLDPRAIYGFIGEGAERLIRRSLRAVNEGRHAEAAQARARGFAAALREVAGRAHRSASRRGQRGRSGNRPGGGHPRLRGHLGPGRACSARLRRLSLRYALRRGRTARPVRHLTLL